MQNIDELEVKKDLFVQLAFSLYGYLTGISKADSQTVQARTAGFVVNEKGNFFLIARNTIDLEDINLDKEVLFTVLKEGRSVSDMFDIKIRGFAKLINSNTVLKQEAQMLFEEKSPYFGNIPFMELGEQYSLLYLEPKSIIFQNLKEEREAKDPYFLEK